MRDAWQKLFFWQILRVPILKKSSGKGRNRTGDIAAILLLIVFIIGFSWLWWQEKHPKKETGKHRITQPAPSSGHQPIIPSMEVVVRTNPAPPEPVPPPARVTQPPSAPEPPVPEPSVREQQPAPRPAVTEFPRLPRDVFEAQIAMVRRAISPGPIDGAIGSQTHAAIAALQRAEKLPETGILDTNTRARLTLDTAPLTTYTVTSNDLARLQPLGKTWLDKSQQSALDYETLMELVAEKFHAHIGLMPKLNPGVDWKAITNGTVLTVPNVEYPDPDDKASLVVIHLSSKYLEAFDAQSNLMAHFPCSIAAKVEKRPVGDLHVVVIAPNPNYTVNPELFPESTELQVLGHKLILPPGPNNPVGVAWVGLDRPGYGIHGTPVPEQVGRTESHGCFRLANWDAEYFVKLAWVGLPVDVVP